MIVGDVVCAGLVVNEAVLVTVVVGVVCTQSANVPSNIESTASDSTPISVLQLSASTDKNPPMVHSIEPATVPLL